MFQSRRCHCLTNRKRCIAYTSSSSWPTAIRRVQYKGFVLRVSWPLVSWIRHSWWWLARVLLVFLRSFIAKFELLRVRIPLQNEQIPWRRTSGKTWFGNLYQFPANFRKNGKYRKFREIQEIPRKYLVITTNFSEARKSFTIFLDFPKCNFYLLNCIVLPIIVHH